MVNTMITGIDPSNEELINNLINAVSQCFTDYSTRSLNIGEDYLEIQIEGESS